MSRSEIAALTRALDARRCVWEVGARFGVLCILVALALRGPWLFWPLVLVGIGIVQYHILVLSHEAQHVLIAREKRLNDWIGAWLLAYPFGQPFHSERERHLKHHQTVGTPADPDYARYTLEDKRPWRHLLLYYLRLATYGKVVEYLRSAASPREAGAAPAERSAGELVLVASAQTVLLGLAYLADPPFHFLFFYALFWVVPLLTVSLVLSEFREFCEHVSSPSTPLRIKSFRGPLWQRLVLGPCGFSWHAEHHLHPAVPHYLLPQVASHYPESSEKLELHVSYFDVIARCRADEAASAPGDPCE